MRTRFAFLFVVFTLLGLDSAFAQATAPPLVSRIVGAFDAPVAASQRGVARSRIVDINTAVLTQIQADLRNSPGVAQQIGIEFFPDRSFVVQVTRVEAIGNGSVSFTGTVAGLPFITATIIQNGNAVAANVAAFGRVYQIRFRGAAGHEVSEFDPSDLNDHGDVPPPEINAVPIPKRAALQDALLDDGSTIDVMVVWTPASRTIQGGVAAMQTLVALGISETNTAYANSGVIQRLRLVYSGEVNHIEGAISPDLGLLAGNGDGVLDQVHAIRDAVGADYVSLWGEYGNQACGIGFLMATESSGFATNAFNVVNTPCATGNYSFGHELGHNMGLRHDPFIDPAATTIDTVSVAYAHGYVDIPNRMRTIMAYNDQCQTPTQPVSFTCTRMQRFANVGLNMTSPFNAVVAPSGLNPNSNDFLALNGTRDTTANFRQSVDQTGAGKVTFYVGTRTVSEAIGSVTLTVGRLAGSTGAAAVSWSTAPNTALAGTHYTTAGGTLNWAAGDTVDKTVTVSILQNGLTEPDKSFTVNLATPVGAVLGPIASTTVVIRDDEPDTWPLGACVIPSGFTNSATTVAGAQWTTASDSTYQGTCALKSGPIPAANGSVSGNNISSVEWTGVTAAGTASFKYRVSSYPNNGNMQFLVDGVQALTNTGASGWVSFTSAPLTAGTHTLTWRYVKTLNFNCSNASPPAPEGSACADRLWIDDVFIPVNFTLTVAKSGTGSGTVTSTTPAGGISCGADCTEPYLTGTSVTLAATPAAASAFTGWSGACTGTGACTVSMTAARSVTAGFARIDPAKPDWNADAKPDVIWSNTANGNTYLWYMNGPVLSTDAFLAGIDPSWKIQGVADFNGDGKPDLVWRNTANGNTYVWYMNGSTFLSDAFLFGLPPEWVIQGVADFNGDGKPDFLMRNTITGVAFAWYFNDNVAIGDQFLFGIDPQWKVEAVADLNGDGQPDLLFRNMTSGLAFAWNTQYSAGNLSLASSSAPIFGIDPVWEIVQMEDWNSDNNPDLLFRNRNTGVVFVWYMTGTTLQGSDFITQIDPSWEIVPRR